jgi:hypothetical protein
MIVAVAHAGPKANKDEQGGGNVYQGKLLCSHGLVAANFSSRMISSSVPVRDWFRSTHQISLVAPSAEG